MVLEDKDLIIEALLFASPEPLTQKKVNIVFENDPPNLEAVSNRLSMQYIEKRKRGYLLRKRSGW